MVGISIVQSDRIIKSFIERIRVNMAKVINSLDKATSNSQKKRGVFQILIRSLIAGVLGYSIFLITLTATYPILYKYFGLGKRHVSGEDLILSTIGFLVLYTTFVVNQVKDNNFMRKS